jgi:hypothetical protein
LNRSRGSLICDNDMTISETALTRAFLAALTETLSDSDVVDAFANSFLKHAAKSLPVKDQHTVIERQLGEAETKVAAATKVLLRMPDSAAMDRALNEAEHEVARLRRDLATLGKPAKASAPALPTKASIRAAFGRFTSELAQLEPKQARELLARVLPEPLVLTPKTSEAGRGFHVTGFVGLSSLVEDKCRSGGSICPYISRLLLAFTGAKALISQRSMLAQSSCAGTSFSSSAATSRRTSLMLSIIASSFSIRSLIAVGTAALGRDGASF